MQKTAIRLVRTNSNNRDFIDLVLRLDSYLAESDGDEHDFYHQFNGIESLQHVILAYKNKKPVACGAIKEFEKEIVEIKRMYTSPENRRNGLGSIILNELEEWATELDYSKSILETGRRQPEAIALYKKNGYQIIENYGQYKGVDNSVCFEKILNR